MGKFVRGLVAYVGCGLLVLSIASAFAVSISYTPTTKVDQFGKCVGFITLNQEGKEFTSPVCPNDWRDYKPQLVRTK